MWPQILTGVINQTSMDHIGLLVFGTFNASIAAENLKESYSYNEDTSEWTDGETDEVVGCERAVRFEVVGVDTFDDFITIRGSLLSQNTGVVASSTNAQKSGSMAHLTASARRRLKRNSMVSFSLRSFHSSLLFS
eukprot:m.394344 g.394344  ORF g.394344 m.394344 type:complete len:135 (-) comp56371_c0_seq28:77-481(-)